MKIKLLTRLESTMKIKLLTLFLVALGLGLVLLFPVNMNDITSVRVSGPKVDSMDLSGFAESPPGQRLDLVFIHHSVGGTWLATPGPAAGVNCIFTTHPNGGGLRSALEEQGYEVHEASYGSRVGEDTNIMHWPSKFRGQMEEILTCQHQDTPLPDGRQNQIVMFKSCYPNNAFVAFVDQGTPPGRADGSEKTVANAQAAYTALLATFARHPGVLSVCVTAPPLAPKRPREPLWKSLARRMLGKPDPGEQLLASGRLARTFNNWLKAKDGWLKDYPHRNVVVFDYYDVLTDAGASDLSRYPTGDGLDSHPRGEGQQRATVQFVPFINRAVRRAGLIGQ